MMKRLATLWMVAALLTAGGLFTAAGLAYAQCPPTTTGNDTLVNDGNCGTSEVWSGQAGNDDLTNAAGSSMGALNGDDGRDTLTNDGQINGSVNGGEGRDTITNNGTVLGAINSGGSEVDTVVNNGTVGGTIYGSTVMDYITNNGTVEGDISSGQGHDRVTNSATGTVEGNIIGGEGQDIIVNDGTVDGNVTGDWSNDTITNNGHVGGNIDGGQLIDTIVNNGTVDGVILGGPDTLQDNLVNNGTAGGMNGGGGGDTIVNNGTLDNAILGGDGDDTITNNGQMGSYIQAGNGDDTITSTGQSGHILGADGDDTVTLGDGAEVNGIISGGNGTDVLEFTFTVYSNEYPAIAAYIAGSNPAGGSLSLNGNTYTWLDFEQLVDLLNVLEYVEPSTDSGTTIVVQVHVAPSFEDGRLNAYDIDATAVLYCASDLGGIDTYSVAPNGGDFAFQVLSADILPAITEAVASGQNVLIAQQLDVSLWALASGELQANGRAGYVFTFPPAVCGILD